jgi:hypothetical protein
MPVDQTGPLALEKRRYTVRAALNATPDELAARVVAEIAAALRRHV